MAYTHIYTGTQIINGRTNPTYDVQLLESFNDGESWTYLNFSFDVNGYANKLYYLGNQHLYLLEIGRAHV